MSKSRKSVGPESPRVRRRDLLGTLAAVPAVALAKTSAADEQTGSETGAVGEPSIRTDISPVETTAGKVRGVLVGGVYTYKGIPYADSPVGEHRFSRAPKLTPWTGIRDALNYGPRCPIELDDRRDRATDVFRFLSPTGQPSDTLEDCLKLNIWAPQGDSGHRPVMVWLHAGGFRRGYAQEYLAADGSNLARRHDAIVVSLNHRIGPLGFTNLFTNIGSEAADSANVGMLDIVDALKWIQENIEAFGGDPDNVTVFGQSGGGFKISLLLAMPPAEGLFHRAIIQSGARLRIHDEETTARLASETIKALGIAENEGAIQKLRDLPVSQYLTAARLASEKIRQESNAMPRWASPDWWFEPTAGLPHIPDHPGSAGALTRSQSIPLICGCTRNEISPSGNHPELEQLTWSELPAELEPELGDMTPEAIAAARNSNSEWRPVDVLSVLLSRDFRLAAVEYCNRASSYPKRAVYNYMFSWHTPLFDGRPRAFHTSDVAFVFDNAELVPELTCGGEAPTELAHSMSSYWTNFARSGDPNAGAHTQPHWPRYGNPEKHAMIFDDSCRAEAMQDKEMIDLFLRDNTAVDN